MSDRTQATTADSNTTPNDVSINNQHQPNQQPAEQGGEQQAASTQTEPPLSPRARQMQEIIANRQAVQNEELIYGEQLGDAARQASGQAASGETTPATTTPTTAGGVGVGADTTAQNGAQSTATQTTAQNDQSNAAQANSVVIPQEAIGADGRISVTVANQKFRLTQEEVNALVADGANASLALNNAQIQQPRVV